MCGGHDTQKYFTVTVVVSAGISVNCSAALYLHNRKARAREIARAAWLVLSKAEGYNRTTLPRGEDMATNWISVPESVKLSGYTANHIRVLIRNGRVKAQKFATVWQVDRKSLFAYVREQEQKGERRGRKPTG